MASPDRFSTCFPGGQLPAGAASQPAPARGPSCRAGCGAKLCLPRHQTDAEPGLGLGHACALAREGGPKLEEAGQALSVKQSIGYRLVDHASGLWRRRGGPRWAAGLGLSLWQKRGKRCGVAGGGQSVAARDRTPPGRTRLWLISACVPGGRGLAGLALCGEMGQWSMWPQGQVAAWGGLQGTGLAVCPRFVFSGFWTSRGLGLPG